MKVTVNIELKGKTRFFSVEIDEDKYDTGFIQAVHGMSNWNHGYLAHYIGEMLIDSGDTDGMVSVSDPGDVSPLRHC